MAKDTRPRQRNGKLARNPDTAERDAKAAKLRARGLEYADIAREMGYTDKSAAYKAVQRCLRDTLTEPGDELRKLELDRLDAMQRAVQAILDREHVSISQGRVVRRRGEPKFDEHGDPVLDAKGQPEYEWNDVLDDGPALAAVDRLLKIQERRARLLGLDTPTKSHVMVERVDPRDLELSELLNEAKAKAAVEESALKGESGR